MKITCYRALTINAQISSVDDFNLKQTASNSEDLSMRLSSRGPQNLIQRHFPQRCRAHLVIASAGPRVRYAPTRYSACVPTKTTIEKARVELHNHLKTQSVDIPLDRLELLSQDDDDFVFQFKVSLNTAANLLPHHILIINPNFNLNLNIEIESWY